MLSTADQKSMQKASVDLVKRIDFGDIDGLYDKRLQEYFYDENYWNNIAIGNVFYVIGRKGTGKSAIYNWIHSQQSKHGALVSNLSFKDFPFEKLLRLSDDNFAKPNQYQSIWRNIILSEIAKLIILDQNNIVDDNYQHLKMYVDYHFGKNITDLHKQITMQTDKTNYGLFKHLAINVENSENKTMNDGIENITQINRMLDTTIKGYLKVYGKTQYIIQFDQLDDNYTVYTNNDSYFQSIISLFKAVYDINQSFRKEEISVKVIAYLRSDIFYSINNFDPESARWDQFKFNLNWAIVNRSDWDNPRLLQIINRRINSSLPSFPDNNPFYKIFDNSFIRLMDNNNLQDVFRYIVHRTFHRPRDIIQFCIKIQDEVNKKESLYFRTIKDAEKEYSLWLLSEVANELAPKIPNLEDLYEFLRLFGTKVFSMSDFKARYTRYQVVIGYDPEELLKLLYRFGILINVNDYFTEFFSIIRNDRSVFNRDLKILIHSGFVQGLYVSKFLKR